MDLSFASKAAQAKAQIADALKRLPPAPPPGTPPAKPLGAPPAPVPPQGGPQAPAPLGAPPPASPLAVMGMQPQAQPQPAPPQQAPNLAVPRAYAKGGKVRKPKRSLAVQFKGN